ncbi:HAMP domain-containing sensor histidine kinase [Flavobacterium sp.]|uniref:sensor histidine kinase n=1 Tax=Flavobacterium sp. TaxID=239 RepID=UPI0026336627|nr:HAMP domain-containing sensor histidine kinase [Flavobacterium sp.]
MLNFSFKNRIAFNYIISTALLVAIVFLVIYQVVFYSVSIHIDDEIKVELDKHLDDVKIDNNDTYLIQVDQWRAREHNSINVNPVFVQFYDNNKKLIDKSPNLKSSNLILSDDSFNNDYINSYLNDIPIRQIQTPILNNNKVVGYVVLAMSLDDFEIIDILKNILFLTYPIILIILFFIARFFAGRSIKPVTSIIETSSKITKDNLKSRILLPNNKDELYTLSKTINDLLDRIEDAIEREKQFTSDASHELRTPLAVIKGTLEVLIRKPREKQEYEDKINFCVSEVDRLNSLVDELLLLARFENQKQNNKIENVYLNELILESLSRYSDKIKKNDIVVSTNFNKDFYVQSDYYLVSIIISNLISNSVKYSKNGGQIIIDLDSNKNATHLTISDNGIGIPENNLSKIFNSFYRSDNSKNPEIKGTGLGLSIVKRLCDLLNIEIQISSQENIGTTIILSIT